MRSLSQQLLEEFAKRMAGIKLVWCLCVEAAPMQAFYFVRSRESLGFLGQIWTPMQFDIGTLSDKGDGNLANTSLSFSNIGRVAMPYLEAGLYDQRDALLIPAAAENPDARARKIGFVFAFYIQGASATAKVVTLNTGVPNFFEQPFPRETFSRAEEFPGIKAN